jgi:hypothetical protein
MKNVLARVFACVRRLHRGRKPFRSLSVRPSMCADLESLEERTLLSTFTVSNVADGGPGSLRQAILGSNAALGSTNIIKFAITGTGVETINLNSPLPAITNSVAINGASQPGYTTTPLILLKDPTAGSTPVLVISAPGVSIRGLEIDRVAIAIFDDGRVIASQGVLPIQTNSNPAHDVDHVVQRVANWIGATVGTYLLTLQGDPRTEVYSLTVSWASPSSPAPGLGGDGFRFSPLGEVTGSATDLIASFGPLNTVGDVGSGDASGTATPISSAPLGSALLASFGPGQSIGFGQSLRLDSSGDSGGGNDVADARPSSDSGTAGGLGNPVSEVAPWAPFADGLEEGWRNLRARLTDVERSVPILPADAIGAAARDPQLQTRAPGSPNTRAVSQASRDRGDEGTGSGKVDDGPRVARTATNGTGDGTFVTGVSLPNPAGIESTVATIDAALGDLGKSKARADVVVGTEPPPAVDRAESQASPVLAIAAASLTLSVTLERTMAVARRRSAGRNPRRPLID